jgi:hypothetical protein
MKAEIKRRTSRPVLVYNKQGQLVKEYDSVKAASEDVGIKEYRIRNLIYEGKSRHGLIYKLGRRKQFLPALEEDTDDTGRQQWEGRNGMFNIKGWAKMPLFA